MQIALFIDDISRDGGTERCTIELANNLTERGNDVSIVTINASNKEIKYSVLPTVKNIKFNENRINNKLKRRFKTLARFENVMQNIHPDGWQEKLPQKSVMLLWGLLKQIIKTGKRLAARKRN